MKILVTGGAGYIGSILTPELLKIGHKVTVIDNFFYNQTSLLDCCYNPNLSIIKGDVRNRELMLEMIKDVDFIIPLACLVGAPICDKMPIEAQNTNFDAVKMILEIKNPKQGIIFPTTNSGYGLGQRDIYCTEETPLNPISLYGKLKVDIEIELLKHNNVITLRLATVFGISPRMRLDLLTNDFVYRAVNDRFIVLYESHFKRNFIHLRDVARAFIHCINNFEVMKNQAYNVGHNEANISKIDLCLEIKKQLPYFNIFESDFGKDPDKRNYIVSNDKIEKSGFKAIYSLPDGITELIKGYQIIKRNQYSNI